MAEEQKPADGGAAAAQAGADQKPAEGGSGAPDNKGTDGGGGEPDKKSEDGADKGTDDGKPKDDGEPKTRKSNVDFILQRKNNKIAKMEKRSQAGGDGEGNGKGEGDGAGDGDEDLELIDKRVDERLTPFIEREKENELKAEVSSFIQANPVFKTYEAQIIKHAKHPAYAQVPIEIIANGLAGKELMRIGAERQKEADAEAKKSQTGGGSSQGGDGATKYSDMSPADHAAELNKVLNKPRN